MATLVLQIAKHGLPNSKWTLRLSLDLYFDNAFSKMHFAENSVFDKIQKLLLRSDYVEWNCVLLVF
jgi:hypothetical protein